MRRTTLFMVIALVIILMTGCVRQFTIIPQMKDLEFSVSQTFGELNYTPIADARNDFDKKGKVENSCSGGKSGITHLGDKNFKNSLLPEFNKNLIKAIINSHLFSKVDSTGKVGAAAFTFGSSLDKYQVTLDEAKAQQTQACVGGIIGAAIAASIDVTATTDIQLTGILKQGEKEVWRHTVSKQVLTRDDYSNTEANAQKSMGDGIGEACKELVTEMAKYLAQN